MGAGSGFSGQGPPAPLGADLPLAMVGLAGLLDQILGVSTDTPGPFQEGLRTSAHNSLHQSYENLSSSEQNRLSAGLSEPYLQIILNLGEERDAEIFYSDALSLARTLADSQDPQHRPLAIALCDVLAVQESGRDGEARALALALRGQGDLGRRLELATSDFVERATDPSMLLSLGVASSVFKGTYAAMFSRLAPAQRVSGLGALWRARTISGAVALGVEGPAFVLAETGLRYSFGHEVSWSREHLWDQTLATYLTLGMLRGSGVVTRTLGGIPLTGPRSLLDQGLLATGEGLGIYANFGLQEAWGMREGQGPSQRFLDSLVFFAQARTAGRLSHELLGPRHQRFLTGLDQQIRRAEQTWQPPTLPNFAGNLFGIPQWAAVGPAAIDGLPRQRAEGPSQAHIMFNEALGAGEGVGGAGGGRPLGPKVIEQRMELIVRPVFGKDFEPGEVPTRSRAKKVKRIGVLTSGGDGPAENAAIAALVEGALKVSGMEVMGIRDGFKGLLEPEGRISPLTIDDIQSPTAVRQARGLLYGDRHLPRRNEQKRHIKYLGGNILRSSRTNPILDGNAHRVQETMQRFGIEALVVMGGNGSQRASRELAEHGVKLVFLPQSIDADVPGSVVSIGFPSAVNEGSLTIPKFLNTAQSCQRYFLVEVMGQRYGLLTLGIAYSASRGRYFQRPYQEEPGVKVAGVFTEIPRSLSEIPRLMSSHRTNGMDHGVFLIGEGVRFNEASPPREIDAKSRVLIEAGDISRWVRGKLLEKPYQVNGTRSVSLGYTLRGAQPSLHDTILASGLAKGAMSLIQNGAFGRMVGLDFLPGSAMLTTVFPKLSEVAGRQVQLDPQYFEHIRASVEESSRN